MASVKSPSLVKIIARHLMREIPRVYDHHPRDLIELSRDLADFSDHPVFSANGHALRMAASQLLSVRSEPMRH